MNPNSTAVFSFPIKAPEGAVTRDDVSALSQLELCLAYQRHWCEHKPSITVTVRENEWMDVGAWVYKHFDEVSGELLKGVLLVHIQFGLCFVGRMQGRTVWSI